MLAGGTPAFASQTSVAVAAHHRCHLDVRVKHPRHDDWVYARYTRETCSDRMRVWAKCRMGGPGGFNPININYYGNWIRSRFHYFRRDHHRFKAVTYSAVECDPLDGVYRGMVSQGYQIWGHCPVRTWGPKRFGLSCHRRRHHRRR